MRECLRPGERESDSMTQQRDLIAHKATSLRIVVLPLAVKNFLPKGDPTERFRAGCRKIGHSRYNSVTSVVGSCPPRFLARRTTCTGYSGYGFPLAGSLSSDLQPVLMSRGTLLLFRPLRCPNCPKSKRWSAGFALRSRGRPLRHSRRVPARVVR